MRKSFYSGIAAAVLGLAATAATAREWYVNDASTEADVYCTSTGHSANTGRTPDSPKDSWASLVATESIAAGDVVYMDTGTYPAVRIDGCMGTADAPIRLLGVPGRTIFRNTTSGILTVNITGNSRYLQVEGIRVEGNRERAISISGATYITFRDFSIETEGAWCVVLGPANHICFENGLLVGGTSGTFWEDYSVSYNEFRSLTIISPGGTVLATSISPVNQRAVFEECIIDGAASFSSSVLLGTNVVRNIIHAGYINPDYGSLAEAQAATAGWEGMDGGL